MAGLVRGLGLVALIFCAGLFGLLECATVEVLDTVGMGCTGPIERKVRAKSGSDASILISSDLEVEARGGGFTVGP